MTDKMKEKIVILEFADEAEAFLNYCRENSISASEFKIIALQPQVQVFLKNRNIPCENTLPYFSNQSHAKALAKSEEWYQFLAKTINIEDSTEIKETYDNTFLFYLRFYVHHFLMYIEVLSVIYEKHEIESIHACVYQNNIHAHNPPHIQDDERYAGIIARTFSQLHDITFKEIPAQFKSEATPVNKPSVSVFRKTAEKIISGLYKYLLFSYLKRKKVILLTTTAYNVDNLTRRLKEELPTPRWAVISDSKPYRCLRGFLYRRFSEVMKLHSFHKVNYFLDVELPIDSFQRTNTRSSENSRQLEKRDRFNYWKIS